MVTAPVKEDGVLNIVMGVNENLYDKAIHPIVTPSSFTGAVTTTRFTP